MAFLRTIVRSLARDRALSATAVVTMGIGAAALIATFAMVDAAVLRPPPFPAADRLVVLTATRTRGSEAPRRERWSFPRLQALRAQSRVFNAVGSFSRADLVLTGGDEAEPIGGEVASAAYFSILGVVPLHGRLFTEGEAGGRTAAPVALIGESLWRRRLGADPDAVGRVVRLNGVPVTVVGVLPAAFAGVTGAAEAWIPPGMAPSVTYDAYLTTGQSFISAIARLAPGATLASANAEIELTARRIAATLPPQDLDARDTIGAVATPLNAARVDPRTRRSLFTLFGAVSLLFVLAAANAASLLLGRALARRREHAVRLALGAGRARVGRAALAEGAVLAAAGVAAGAAAAWALVRRLGVPAELVSGQNFYGAISPFTTPHFGTAEVVFSAAVAALAALLIGLPPAIVASRAGSASLTDGARGHTATGVVAGRLTLRGVIVAFEAALAVVLLVGGGLMADSFRRIRATDAGFDPEHLLTFRLQVSEVQVPPAQAPAFIDRVLGAINGVPGVRASSVDGCAPLGTTCANADLYVVGAPVPPPDQVPAVLRHYVAPGHFATLGIRLVAGRAFTSDDRAGRPHVAIVNETAARRFWPAGDALGARVWWDGAAAFASPDSAAEVVGIVSDVAYQPFDSRPFQADFFTPYAQFTYASRMVLVRTEGDPAAAAPAIREALRRVAPDVPMRDVQTMRQRMGGTWARHRFDAALLGGFAALALLLAMVGIYAVVSYEVTARTREMGIRMALGATAGSVIRFVLRDGMVMPLAGTVAGVVASFWLWRLAQASLYEVTATDPQVLGAMALLLTAAAGLACLVPARRATRADPVEALRAD